MTVNVEGIGEFADVKYSAKISEVSNADLDEDFTFEFDSAPKKEDNKKHQVSQIFKDNKKNVQNDIRKIFDDLRENYLNK